MAITADAAMGSAPTGETMTDNPQPTGSPAPESDSDSELPDEVLKLPVINSLMNGAPPAVYAAADAKIPEIKVIDKYSKELINAGFSAYGTSDGKNKVLFNQLFVTPDEIKSADANGTLIDSLAVSYDELVAGYEGAKLKKDDDSTETPAKESSSSTPASSGPRAPASVDKKLATARLQSLAIGSPTSGPAPGQGRILNSAMKPVV